MLPNRSVTGWGGQVLDEVGGLEKAFQSPNSPFPLDDAAAGHRRGVICLHVIAMFILDFGKNFLSTSKNQL